ncbi:MAG: 2-oxoacid:acceptor oxidoreductase family protein [Spirochaetaceae bacterium]|jgi:2-oxoglutarate ferredoxin oxidoreductase subunit gamma|nr:2-oxoacid:acceptor oxidoreductase family protein [Spirochaetaceae bacterium]
MIEKSFFAGFGGQGIISLGQIWVYCGLKEGKNVSFFPAYGAEKRGGASQANVVVSSGEIASPLVNEADSAVAMSAEALPVCERALKQGGILLANSSLIKEKPSRKDIRLFYLPLQDIAQKIGGARFTNMAALGALARLTGALALNKIENILQTYFTNDKHKFLPLNISAIRAGFDAAETALTPA